MGVGITIANKKKNINGGTLPKSERININKKI
jgi:hypothetical protein